MRMSQLWLGHWSLVGSKMSSRRNWIWSLALRGRRRSVTLCSRFFLAREMAAVDLSTPRSRSAGVEGARMELRRRGIQPVPVQRSRMRRGFFWGFEWWRREAR